MSCDRLHSRSWKLTTANHNGSTPINYEFMLQAFNQTTGRFIGTVSLPPNGTINGRCIGGAGSGPRVIRFIITIPGDRSIHLVGSVREKDDRSGLLQFTGSYDNLLDPGETGSGSGEQQPA